MRRYVPPATSVCRIGTSAGTERTISIITIYPSSHTICNVVNITRRGAFAVVEVACVNSARVVTASRFIDVAVLVDALDETITISSALRAIDNHLRYARGLDLSQIKW